jgi:dTDP-4-dehydrorhamnose reductase
MKVLITGAKGMVARAAADYCRSIGDDVVALAHSEMDIANHQGVKDVVGSTRPDAVLNCAAYTNVDGAETHKQLAYDANATGVENLAEACKAVDARFVTISTDYVFDGSKDGFYTQRDTPLPRGAYAMTKYYGEILARNTYARSIVVRSGWIFGKGGTNFLSVVDKLLAEGKQILAISDAFGTPTFADSLARRLRELAELDLPGTFHITNAGVGTSYLGFAEKVCELGGFDRGLLKPISMNDLDRPAPRPVNSRLSCLFSQRLGLSPLEDWTAALEDHLRRN